MLLYAIGLGTGAYLMLNGYKVNGKPYSAGNIIGIFFLVMTVNQNLGNLGRSIRGIAEAKVSCA